MRIAIIGNAGGGKSTLAGRLAAELSLPLHEIDALLWRPGWAMVASAEFEAVHRRLLAADEWIVEGLGPRESLEVRIERSTHVILCDFPLWQHYWLLAERQTAWSRGELAPRPAGLEDAPPTRALFEMVWTIDRDWMPWVRDRIDAVERRGTVVFRIGSVDALERFRWPASG